MRHLYEKTRIITPIIIFSAAMILSCATINLNQRPTAEIVNFDIESMSLRDITLLFDVEIRNPYPIPLKLNAIQSVC